MTWCDKLETCTCFKFIDTLSNWDALTNKSIILTENVDDGDFMCKEDAEKVLLW